MGSNRLPDAQGPLFSLAHDMKDGADKHGVAVGLVHHTALTLGPALDLAETTQRDYKKADKAVADAGIALRLADSNGKGFIATVHESLKRTLGIAFNPTWAEMGFKNNSLAVPGSPDDRLTLVNSMNQFFTDHPTLEINDAAHNVVVTAAAAKSFWQAIVNGRSGVNGTQEDYLNQKVLRDNADLALRDEMSGLISELGDLLDDLDPRWLWFGLNQPGAVNAADPVANLNVTPIVCGFLAVWPHAANASLYHLEIQIIGTDAEFRRVATTTETTASQTGLPSVATVDVRVLSVSENGTEALPSNVVRTITGK